VRCKREVKENGGKRKRERERKRKKRGGMVYMTIS
jgi:hypothetical protein